MPGGTGDAQDADEEIQAMCTALKDAALEKAQASGWNGLFTEFTAKTYKTQVVAGTNYFVKVNTGGDKHVHVRIFKPLPHTGSPPEVRNIQVEKTAEDALEYF